MLIDIKKADDGSWAVIAHATYGDCHDFFETQQEAVDFAISFYGGTLKVVGYAPQTTHSRARYYQATEIRCKCKDAARGGSWLDLNGNRSCKHSIHIQKFGHQPEPSPAEIEKIINRLWA